MGDVRVGACIRHIIAHSGREGDTCHASRVRERGPRCTPDAVGAGGRPGSHARGVSPGRGQPPVAGARTSPCMAPSTTSVALPGAPSKRSSSRPAMLPGVQRRRNPPDRTERRLARRLRRGDPDVIADLYTQYGSASYGVLLRTLRDRDDADDVQQQVFAEVWRRAAQYDPERAGLLTWILTIARSRAIDHLRRRVPEPVSSDEMIRLTGDGDTPPETDLALDRWRAIELLAVLPDHERELLRLRFYEELSQTEIAARLDLPLGTVKARMVRALRKLRVHIAEGEVAP